MTKKNQFFWKALNSISGGYKPIPKNEFDLNEKEYQPYMIMKWLSQDITLSPILKYVNNREARTAPLYTHYLGLFYLMMPHKRFRNFFKEFGFAKAGQDKYSKEEIQATMQLWDTSPKDAIRILNDITDKEREELVNYCKRIGIYDK